MLTIARSGIVLLACAALALTAGPLAAADGGQPAANGDGPTVSVAAARTMPFTETILVTGSLIAREEVLVAPQIDGLRVAEILAEEGDTVTAGQVLARLNSETLKAQLEQQEANLLRADATIEQSRNRITEAEANQKQAQAAFERADELLKSGSTSRSVYDEREAAARTAGAAVRQAKDGLHVSQAEKAQIDAQIRESKLRLGYADIKAPEAGIISRRMAKVGALAASTADPLFRIITKGEVELDAEVPEIYLPRLTIGQTVSVEVAGLKASQGKIRLISPTVDAATRLGRVRIFIGKDPRLHVGSFARGAINAETRDALGIPASAILARTETTAVKVVKDGVIETRRITTGMRSGGNVEVVDGLKDGELVVTRSAMLLRDGDKVRTVKSDEKPASETN
jgi:RND family efflux transporter MFP subunit